MAAPTTRTRARYGWVTKVVITIVSLGGFALAVVMAIRMFGAVQGVEFSPDTFSSRAFIYYEIPLIRIRVTGVYRDDVSGVLQKQVGGVNFAPQSSVDPPRWDLVAMTKGGGLYTDDALIIYRYLQSYSQLLANSPSPVLDESASADFWLDWTNKHAKLAKIFWTAIAELCRSDLYTLTPALFLEAEQLTAGAEPSPRQFEKALDKRLAEQYTQLADVRRSQDLHEEAIELYTAALEAVPDDRKALSGREKSYYKAGEREKSKQDRRRLKELEQ